MPSSAWKNKRRSGVFSARVSCNQRLLAACLFSAVPISRAVAPSFPTRRSSDLLYRGEPAAVEVATGRGTQMDLRIRLFLLHEPMPATELAKAVGSVLATKRSEEHTSELQSRGHLVCRLLLGKIKGGAACFRRASAATSGCSLLVSSRPCRSAALWHPLSLHDALPIFYTVASPLQWRSRPAGAPRWTYSSGYFCCMSPCRLQN